MCVFISFFCFVYFFAFLSPKYFFLKSFSANVEKNIDLWLTQLSLIYEVSSTGMQDHLLTSASSGLCGNPIPTVSSLQTGSERLSYKLGLSALEVGYTPPSILTEGVEGEREGEREEEGGRCLRWHLLFFHSIRDGPKFHSEVSLLPLKLYFKPLYVCILSHWGLFYLEAFYMTVGLQTGEEDVKEPEAE